MKAPRAFPVGSSVNVAMHLSHGMRPVVGAGCAVRLSARNQMGIHLGRLEMTESQRSQEFLLPLIPGVK